MSKLNHTYVLTKAEAEAYLAHVNRITSGIKLMLSPCGMIQGKYNLPIRMTKYDEDIVFANKLMHMTTDSYDVSEYAAIVYDMATEYIADKLTELLKDNDSFVGCIATQWTDEDDNLQDGISIDIEVYSLPMLDCDNLTVRFQEAMVELGFNVHYLPEFTGTGDGTSWYRYDIKGIDFRKAMMNVTCGR